jgi:phosphoribosyl-AMP cyclohydrolase
MSDPTEFFGKRQSVEQVEEGDELAPKFDANGLIPVVTTDYATGRLLMHAYMNDQALAKTIETGEAHYYSRSRDKLWRKGESSGLIQQVKELLVDDDQDCVWMRVEVAGSGASCHVGYQSCFYRAVPVGEEAQQAKGNGSLKLRYIEHDKTFDPQEVYGDAPNPTQL